MVLVDELGGARAKKNCQWSIVNGQLSMKRGEGRRLAWCEAASEQSRNAPGQPVDSMSDHG